MQEINNMFIKKVMGKILQDFSETSYKGNWMEESVPEASIWGVTNISIILDYNILDALTLVTMFPGQIPAISSVKNQK